MSSRWVAAACNGLVVVALAGCTPPKSSLPPGQVLSYGAAQRDAATSIVIGDDGSVDAVIHWPDRPQQEHRGILSATQRESLAQELEAHRCCAIKPGRVYAYANEPRVTLSIRWGALDCAIELWAQEWEENPAAKACAAAVRAATPADPSTP